MKINPGKFTVKTLAVRWFCRICWQHGLASVVIRPYNDKYKSPTEEELLKIALHCHLIRFDGGFCKTPDIRLHYDTKTLATD